MRERQFLGMKKESIHYSNGVLNVDVRDRVIAALVVGCIAHDRMIDGRKMYADLMRAAGLDLDVEQREFSKALAHLPLRERLTAIRGDGHLRPVPPVACERPVDRSRVLARGAVYEGDIRFVDL